MLSFIALLSFAGLVAVWVIYPLVMAGLAALLARRRAIAAIVDASEPTVSVILATRDDVEATRRRIADCLQTSYDPTKVEVVVAVDRQSAASGELGSMAHPGSPDRVTVVEGDRPAGKAATLNAAVRASTGEILVFADVHQRFLPDAIGHLVAALRAPRVGAVSGALEIPKAGPRRSLAERYWLYERRLRRSEAVVHSSVGVTGAIWALRRSLWNPLPPQLILDDVYAPMLAVLRGYRVGFASAAVASETRRHEPTQEYRRKVRTLTGVIQVCAWLPQVLNPLRNPIWLQFTIHKLLRFLTPYWLAAIGLWAAVAAGRLLGGSWWVAAALAATAMIAVRLTKPNAVKLVGETLVSGALLQTATIVGAVNGFRGRWNVWHN